LGTPVRVFEPEERNAEGEGKGGKITLREPLKKDIPHHMNKEKPKAD